MSKKKQKRFLRDRRGFSLIEMLIVVTLLAIVVIMTSDTFTIVIKQSGQQTRIVESQIEGIIGLEMLRTDIERAGYGLPWAFLDVINYSEATISPATNYNDSSSNAPRAILMGDNTGLNGSDYLVIKSVSVATNDTCQKWTYIIYNQAPKAWSSNALSAGERVTVIKPKLDITGEPKLVVLSDGTFFCQMEDETDGAGNTYATVPAGFRPTQPGEKYIIYGIDSDTALRMPFNRADYYVKRPGAGMPSHCAPGTGILYKGVINQGDGALTELPLIDCVADMQIIIGLDTNSDGVVDSRVTTVGGLTAQQIREQIKEVRVYILAQEGERDTSYKHEMQVMVLGEFGLVKNLDLGSTIGTAWNRYRWKQYALVVKPKNLYQ
jgi:prepilin-type N-terminal cleavage/methylation domain-containing protein